MYFRTILIKRAVAKYEQAARFIKKRIYPDAARPPDAGHFADYAGGAAYNIRFAINTDVKHLKTAVFDQSLSAESRELLNSFTASEYFDLIYIEDSFEDVNRRVDAATPKWA